ncbi:MAG TPA: hypothetical protein VFQ71_11655 [Gaiellales bacterium]|jgi:hypothetical protein|nr:hypothetical protein [Gaiellales bacterium]
MTRIRNLTCAATAALVALAIAAPAAQAMPAPRTLGPSLGHRTQATRPAPVNGAALAARYGSWQLPASSGDAAATAQSDHGFTWSAAAMGTALVALVLGALGVTATRMRARRFAH